MAVVDLPSGVLLEPVVIPALRARHCTACPPARLERNLCSKSHWTAAAAARSGAGGVPDLGQVPEQHPGVVAGGLVPVVAASRWRSARSAMSRSRCPGPGGQPPGPVAAGRAVRAGRGEGEPTVRRGGSGRPGPVRRVCARLPWCPPVRAGRSRARWRARGVGHRDAPGSPRVAGGGRGQVAGQVGVNDQEQVHFRDSRTPSEPGIMSSGNGTITLGEALILGDAIIYLRMSVSAMRTGPRSPGARTSSATSRLGWASPPSGSGGDRERRGQRRSNGPHGVQAAGPGDHRDRAGDDADPPSGVRPGAAGPANRQGRVLICDDVSRSPVMSGCPGPDRRVRAGPALRVFPERGLRGRIGSLRITRGGTR